MIIIPTEELKVSYEALDKDSLKNIIFELKKIKSFIFKNTISKINYLRIYKETGEIPPFYAEIMQLYNIIQYLEYWESRAEKHPAINN